MAERALLFGHQLRQLREAAGLSLSELARRVHYSKSHLSKVETSVKAPSLQLARRCDAELDAGGRLVARLERVSVVAKADETVGGGEYWRMSMAPDGHGELDVVPAREAWTSGSTLTAGWSVPPQTDQYPHGEDLVSAFGAMFRAFRMLGQNVAPGALLPSLVAQAHTLRMAVSAASTAERPPILLLAARFAEYTGWMSQEAGDGRAAGWWTDRAADLAHEAGDRDLGPYALVRHALIALYRGDSITTVAAAQRAQRADCSARVRGLAAQREAQGRALGGDHVGAMRCLDRAADLLGDTGANEMIGSWTVRDPVALARGWCLNDLGRPAQAADILSREMTSIPRSAVRARARYGARLALAHAEAGQLDQACEVAGEVVRLLPTVDSATIRSDVRDLRRVLSRRQRHPASRELLASLATVLADARPAGTR